MTGTVPAASETMPPAGGGTPWLRPLPPVLDVVRPPRTFSPSHIGRADECLLRAVLGSNRKRASVPLPAPPQADLGTAFHKLLERAVRGQIERRGSPEEDARRDLDVILAEANAGFASRVPPGVVEDLRMVWRPREWLDTLRKVLDVAVRYLDRAGQGASPGHAKPGIGTHSPKWDFDSLPSNGAWAEVSIRAPELRLSGQADLVEKSPSGTIIRDLKTGRVMEPDGTVQPHIERQLRLYGLMARAKVPSSPVRLFVDDGSEREISFGETEAAEVHVWLDSVIAQAPADVDVPAAKIATLGPACVGCGFRHVCPTYRSSAPDLWTTGAPHRLPLDVWGIIEHIESTADATRRVRLRDAAGRRVAVSGIHPARVEGLGSGAELHLFGLRTRDHTGSPEAARHPRNFFESDPADGYARAWSLAAFTPGPFAADPPAR